MSYLISSITKSNSIQKAEEICSIRQISSFDTTRLSKKELSNSIGIKDVKEIIQKIYLKPLKSKEKAIIIEDSELLTTEAQNALLKILEEPPENTQIFLMTISLDQILPTIQSRCTIIKIDSISPNSPDSTSRELFEIILNITDSKALELAEKLSKDKETLPSQIEKLILTGREYLLESLNNSKINQKRTSLILKKLLSTHQNLLNTNINARLELENLLLSIST